jgi:hypothetical protein
VLVGIVRFAVIAGITVGVTFLVAVIGGWTNGDALAKVFYVVGSFTMLGAVLAATSPFAGTPYMSQYSRRETQKATPLFIVLGLGLIVIGVLLDSRY